ncbi:NADPH-dependent FMN reductase [Streptomyces sp. SAJ15]|uniref:NADPH-dependent FMN reductase n=1 Tax=Streptomyces sp. SAJ15 TaxID=2011095 RepID=UPI001185EE3A|nr:NADPH-dependent FMN reductase [Streptomyces sp. SAJ15]TVL91625.1 FMN reductase [Streptomyces sp. SAJ15]
MSELKILGISGSLRADSYNSALLRAAQKFAPSGVAVEIYEGLRDVPLYDQDLDAPERRPAAAQELRERIKAADGVLLVTPEFNYSIPGVLKNAIDWASTDWTRTEGVPLLHKPVAITGAAPTNFGSVRAQLALRQVFVCIEADVVVKPEVIVFQAHERFDEGGNLTDETTRGLLQDLLTALAGKVTSRSATAA